MVAAFVWLSLFFLYFFLFLPWLIDALCGFEPAPRYRDSRW